MNLKIKIKQILCKHKEYDIKWVYPKGFMYNEFFDVAQTTREKQIVCKDCDKVLKIILAQWIDHKSIYEETKEEYIKNWELNNKGD